MEDDIYTPVFIQDNKAIGDGHHHCLCFRSKDVKNLFSNLFDSLIYLRYFYASIALIFPFVLSNIAVTTHLLSYIRLSMCVCVCVRLSLSSFLSLFFSSFLIDTKRQAVCAYIRVALSRFVCSVLDGSVSLCALLIFLPPYRIRVYVCECVFASLDALCVSLSAIDSL